MKINNAELFEELYGKFDEPSEISASDNGTSDSITNLENFDDFDNTIILNDEDGRGVPFEFLDLITYNGEDYVILLPKEESDDAEEVVILKVDETYSEDEESYTSVEDEEILQAVFNIFKEKFRDEFNFVD